MCMMNHESSNLSTILALRHALALPCYILFSGRREVTNIDLPATRIFAPSRPGRNQASPDGSCRSQRHTADVDLLICSYRAPCWIGTQPSDLIGIILNSVYIVPPSRRVL